MTNVKSYEEILAGSWDELPELHLLPNGTYRLTCRSAKFNPPKTEAGSPNVMFVYAPQEAGEDVSEDALAELGADYDITGNTIFFRFWIERDTDWQKVKRHIEAHGVDLSGISIEAGLKACKNVDVSAYVTQQTFTNKKTGETKVENVLQNFVPIES